MTNRLKTGADLIKEYLKTLPETPGVYRMLNENHQALYIGKAKNLKKRVASYSQVNRLPNRLQRMVAATHTMEFVTTKTEWEALLLEATLIKKLQPYYNILLRDDKSYPYLLITTDHPYPRLVKHRGAQTLKGHYFGPFASVGAVNEAYLTLQRAFLLRICTDSMFKSRTRPCLQYHIKRCSAPCVTKISDQDYQNLVCEALSFLKGKSQEVQKDLALKMEEASKNLHFEEAALYRDRIRALTHIQTKQNTISAALEDADVFALATLGNLSCTQVFFFRNGQSYGNRSYYSKHDPECGPAEILSTALSQFYADKTPPSLLLLSHEIEESDLLTQALSEKSHHKVTLLTPKRGEKYHLIQHAQKNAEDALARKLAESQSHRALLEEVAEVFDLEAPPQRIEVYDNSHIQGAYPYGVMIVAGPEGFLKKAYRKFAIRHEFISALKGGDDYGMMKEVFKRRFSPLAAHLAHEPPELPEQAESFQANIPDLVIIDGGKGQLSSALEILESLGLAHIPLVAMAKGPERNAGKEYFLRPNLPPQTLEEKSPVLYFLQRLRDEAHRFAIQTHRQKRTKESYKSALDEIPNIGPRRKKQLLQYFGSVKNIADARPEDLQKVPGINKNIAMMLYAYFHP